MLHSHVSLILLLTPYSSCLTRWPGISTSLYYYKQETLDHTVQHPGGVTEHMWLTSDQVQADWAVSPPYLTKLEIPVGAVFPADLGAYWLPADAYYVVIEGSVTLG